MKKAWIWFWMLTKRLFRKYSFLIILLLIPFVVPIANTAMQSESGVLRIAVCNAGTDKNAEKIVASLLESESILLYKKYDRAEEAQRAVETGKADAAWIFSEEFSQKADIYVKEKKPTTMVTVLERENTIPLQLAREKLYGAVYPHVSRLIYTKFMEEKFAFPFSETEMRQYYENSVGGDDIIHMETLYKSEAPGKENYLTAPLRGILSLMMVLCGLAAACYFLQDTKSGRYDWLPAQKRILPMFGTCFAAVAASGVAVFLALYVAGLGVGFGREFLAMLLYIPAVTGFCTFCAVLFRDAGHLGACIPFFMLGMLALSPVFFDVERFVSVSVFLPPWYYLHAIHDAAHLVYMVFYSILIWSAVAATNYLLCRRI